MERLTKYSNETTHENGVCCTHFGGPECCEVGGNCAMNCKWEEAAWSRLAAYEDTGLYPESVEALKLSMMGKAISEITEFDGCRLPACGSCQMQIRTGAWGAVPDVPEVERWDCMM